MPASLRSDANTCPSTSPTFHRNRRPVSPEYASPKILEQFVLLDTFIANRNAQLAVPSASSAFARLLAGPTDGVSPTIAFVLVAEGFKTYSNLQDLERFAKYSLQQSQSKVVSLKSQFYLSEIYRRRGQKIAAVESIDQALISSEKLIPRDYKLLTGALKQRADLFIGDHKFSSAVPLLLRALAIYECFIIGESGRDNNQDDEIKSSLASAYAGTENGTNKAEKILVSLVQNQNEPTAKRAIWLKQLGILYIKTGQLSSAERMLTESVAIFSKLKSMNGYESIQFRLAVSNLASLRSKEKSSSRSHHSQTAD